MEKKSTKCTVSLSKGHCIQGPHNDVKSHPMGRKQISILSEVRYQKTPFDYEIYNFVECLLWER